VKPLTLRRHLLVGLALFVLLALTAGSALLPLGAFNAVSNFATPPVVTEEAYAYPQETPPAPAAVAPSP